MPFGQVQLASNEVSATTNCSECNLIGQTVYAMGDDMQHVKRGGKRLINEEPRMKKNEA